MTPVASLAFFASHLVLLAGQYKKYHTKPLPQPSVQTEAGKRAAGKGSHYLTPVAKDALELYEKRFADFMTQRSVE